MKAKYLFAAVACASLALVSACTEEELGSFSNLKVSPTYLSIPTNGGSAIFTVKADDAWQIDTTGTSYAVNDSTTAYWLTFSTLSGASGETEVTVSADTARVNHDSEFRVICGSSSQTLKITQQAEEVEIPEATIAEVLAGVDGATYLVSGAVTKISSTSYGNFYLADDEGNSLYVYGTVNAQGQYPKDASGGWDSFGIELGDIVTVQGPRSTYQSTIELVDVVVVKVVKSLATVTPTEVSVDSGDTTFVAAVASKGETLDVAIDSSWVSIAGISQKADSTFYTFHVAENPTHSSRSAVITYIASTGSASSTISTSVTQAAAPMSATEGGSGTFADPYTVPGIVANIANVASTDSVYVKGIISRIAHNGEFGSYGNATFFISEDGTTGGTEFEAYRVFYYHGVKWTEGCTQIKVGDEVVLYGLVTVYNGQAETSGSKAYIHSLNGVTSDAYAPYTVPQVVKYISEYAGAHPEEESPVCPDEAVYVKGKISSIKYTYSASYGTATFNISNDGSAEGAQFQAYSVYYLGNSPWVEGDTQIALGDEVVLAGKVMSYKGTPETSSKKAYVYSLNGVTSR